MNTNTTTQGDAMTLQDAMDNAEKQILLNSRQGLRMANYCIRRNIELIATRPDLEAKFVEMYRDVA